MNGILEEAQQLQDQIVADRRWLHQHPEIGFELHETAAYVTRRLQEMGYEPQTICPGGIMATIGDPSEGPCVLLRADMDALPVAEDSGLYFAATNGNAHACGHDTHTAMLLGAAQIIKHHEHELKGCIKLVFQPDEEGLAPEDTTGGDEIYAAGVLDNPSVDAVVALHIMNGLYPAGTIATRPGTMFSSVDEINVQIDGKGAHGSQPYEGVDPINISYHIYAGMQNIIARELDSRDPVVATFGSINSGSAANVIPDHAEMIGTLRALSEKNRLGFQEKATRMVEHIAQAFGGSATVGFLRGIPTCYNDPALTQNLIEITQGLTGEPVEIMPEPFSGSDDLSVLSQHAPTCYFILSSGTAEEGYCWPAHNPHIVFNEDVFSKGTALLANSALELLARKA